MADSTLAVLLLHTLSRQYPHHGQCTCYDEMPRHLASLVLEFLDDHNLRDGSDELFMDVRPLLAKTHLNTALLYVCSLDLL